MSTHHSNGDGEPSDVARGQEAALTVLAEALAPLVAAELGVVPLSGWMSTEAAAAYLDCSTNRVHRLAAAGELEHGRDGTRLKFRSDDLDSYLLREQP